MTSGQKGFRTTVRGGGVAQCAWLLARLRRYETCRNKREKRYEPGENDPPGCARWRNPDGRQKPRTAMACEQAQRQAATQR